MNLFIYLFVDKRAGYICHISLQMFVIEFIMMIQIEYEKW